MWPCEPTRDVSVYFPSPLDGGAEKKEEKMLRKRMFWGLAVVLVCMIIVGCGKKEEGPSGGSELTLARGWKIHYLDQGPEDASVVLFVHGLGGSSEYWKPVLNCPEMQKYRCLAIDMLGFGRSDKPKDFNYSLENHAETIRKFLAMKKVNKVIYVGHSMGGSVGIALVKQADLAEKLVLVDSTLRADYVASKTLLRLSGWGEWKFRLIFPLLKLRAKKLTSGFFETPTPETINMASRVMKQSTSYSFHRSLKGTFLFSEKQQVLEFFKRLQVPHYYIFGTADTGVARMAKDHFRSEPWVHEIEKAKHCPMVEDPVRFCSVLVKILAE